jgi:hypothetical protein
MNHAGSMHKDLFKARHSNVGGTMKTTAGLVLALLLMAGCERTPSTEAAPEERTGVNNAMEQQRDDYVKAMEARLDEFDQKLDGLEERTAAMKGQAKDDFNANIDRLRDERRAVGEKLNSIDDVAVESWQTMKNDVDSSFTKLEQDYQQVASMHSAAPGTPQTPSSR